jgi:hypothetical protein
MDPFNRAAFARAAAAYPINPHIEAARRPGHYAGPSAFKYMWSFTGINPEDALTLAEDWGVTYEGGMLRWVSHEMLDLPDVYITNKEVVYAIQHRIDNPPPTSEFPSTWW